MEIITINLNEHSISNSVILNKYLLLNINSEMNNVFQYNMMECPDRILLFGFTYDNELVAISVSSLNQVKLFTNGIV
jgi:hypothetical protein